MQYRQPRHFDASYTTGPSSVLVNAPTGQALAQLGVAQCMHIRRR